MIDSSEPDVVSAPLSKDSQSFHTVISHLYRGEMHRMTVWRIRLDTTTHWAILLSTGLVTVALGGASLPHYFMLLGLSLNAIFIVFEGRRYQHLHHSKWRIGLLEHNYFARLLCPKQSCLEETWRLQLARDLQMPHYTMSLLMATRLRLRRNYLVLIYFITAIWITKLFIHPQAPQSLLEFYGRLAVGTLIPSWFVAVTAGIFVLTASILALMTPSEEDLEHWTRLEHAKRSQK